MIHLFTILKWANDGPTKALAPHTRPAFIHATSGRDERENLGIRRGMEATAIFKAFDFEPRRDRS